MRFVHSSIMVAGLVMPAVQAIQTRPTSIVNVLEYDVDSAYTKFDLSCPISDELTSPLVFEFQAHSVPTFTSSNITINQEPVIIDWNWSRNRSNQWPDTLRTVAEPVTLLVSVKDNRGHDHDVKLSIFGSVTVPDKLTSVQENVTHSFTFLIDTVDGIDQPRLGFHLIIKPTSDRRLQELSPIRQPDIVDFTTLQSFKDDALMLEDPFPLPLDDASSDDLDIDAEIESLLLLEDQAGDLTAQIAAKKQRIAKCLKTHRDNVPLRHLLEQCDGLVCAAKVIAQRICDKVGLVTQPSSYAELGDSNAQHFIYYGAYDEKPQQTSGNSTETKAASKLQPTPGKNSTAAGSLSSLSTTKALDWSNPASALIEVLAIIATALGLTALVAFLRRKCMSPRTRVERAADREERQNARAYRRAARRAYVRARWNAFVNTVSRFKLQPSLPPRTTDYEEKRALILQDAFLEQELDQAEKGQVMEAEIRELRHAHEIVSSMVRPDHTHHFDLVMPMSDPPPPLVPLPFTPVSRSRASTGTLPSYTSESLPGYTSRLATEIGSSHHSLSGTSVRSLVSSSSDDGLFSGSTANSDAGNERLIQSTPTSSVIDISRPSEDTLRTLHSARSMAHL